ncbi:muscleblind-like protein 3 isoform X2 [Lethenteron reissneri]|uniref:muscleblind-like protein 3 isoform X2 n=1 Tax=Lethenteron reissneri TaxID=7753 RepID=UPI002AB5EF01|nr:muscleblind-like protein 3 isoform X2 [Lethenteron reissneri]
MQEEIPFPLYLGADCRWGSSLAAGPMNSEVAAVAPISLVPRDTKWLTLEVCREFQRGACSRTAEECRYAHPPKHVSAPHGRVIACFDSLKGRCTRENCKYLHPPAHLKTQLEINGKNNLIQQKNLTAMAHMQMMAPSMLAPMHSYPQLSMYSQPASPMPYLSYLSPATPGLGYLPPDVLATAGGAMPGTHAALVMNAHAPGAMAAATAAGALQPGMRPLRTDKLDVCSEFVRGGCPLSADDCRLAHPPERGLLDPADGRVTVCMDFVKGRCSRHKCRYFHPPLHLQAKVKALQHQANQAAAAAAIASMPTGVMTPLPKRAAMDKPNGMLGATFNHALMAYQSGLSGLHMAAQPYMAPGSMFCMAAPTATFAPIMYHHNHHHHHAAAAAAAAAAVASAGSGPPNPLANQLQHGGLTALDPEDERYHVLLK